MALSLNLKHLCFALMVLYVSCSSFSTAQDPLMDFANAAICFDNHTMMSNCMLSLGIDVGSIANLTMRNKTIVAPPAQMSSTDTFCNSPCYDLVMLMVSCIDGLFTNFQFYNPGLMQGVESIFQMACSGSSIADSSSRSTPSPVATLSRDMSNASNVGKMLVSWSSCTAQWMAMLVACFLFYG